MITNAFDSALSEALGPPGPLYDSEVDDLLDQFSARTSGQIESAFTRAGFYDGSATPYAAPASRWPGAANRPTAGTPVVDVRRGLWLVRFNPNPEPRKGEGPDDTRGLDVAESAEFNWAHPERANEFGWQVDSDWSGAGPALSAIEAGDLVVVQRTDPKKGRRQPADTRRGNLLFGLCAVLHVLAYEEAEADKPRLRRSACLLPLVRFNNPVPRDTAKRMGRLGGTSFTKPMQRPGRAGGQSRHLSPIEGDDILDVLSVCGVSPEVLAEPNLAIIAARLRSSATGNSEYFGLRYDHVLRNDARRAQERQACNAARVWADGLNYAYIGTAELEGLAGYDLLFVDGSGDKLQVEVKGYSSKNLSRVHLQPSQYLRAEDAAQGNIPDWRLFALLGAGTQRTLTERVLHPDETLKKIAENNLQVKGGMKAVEELRPRWHLATGAF